MNWFQKFKTRHSIIRRKINTKIKKSYDELYKLVKQYLEEVVKLLKDDYVVFINYDEIGIFRNA